MKIKTMKVSGGGDYAKVADRLKLFREENTKGLIETSSEVKDGFIFFKARILKDKSNPASAEATGQAMTKISGKIKEFEKLETIAVGRALALLGYLANGEIASSEEMEEFENFKSEKELEAFETFKEQVDKIKDVETLREFYKSKKGLGKNYDAYIVERSKSLTKK